ncbi:MAG: carnitine-CoA ligase [Betaproteobacteria bacterium]|jgi:crotonobetaine/carnitine-CoA ligase|nr:carnitine-CoA ligase [Betaproteobacteria bacterium]
MSPALVDPKTWTERTTTPRLLTEQAQRLGDKAFVRFPRDGVELSYAGLARMGEAGSSRLRGEFAIEAARMAAIFLPNGAGFLTSWAVSSFAGLVDIPINHEYRKTQLRFALSTAGAEVVFTNPEGMERLLDEEVRSYLPQVRVIVLDQHEPVAQAVERLRAQGVAPHVIRLSDLVAGDKRERLWESVRGTQLASIRYSSGTTGVPKGVMSSHVHLLNGSANHVRGMRYEERDVLYTPFPLHHSLAGTMGFFGTLQAGGTMVCATRFSASRYWKEAAESGATLAQILYPLLPILLAQPPSPHDRGHAVRYCWTAWPHPDFEARFGTTLVQIYGLTEVGIVSYRHGNPDSASRSAGKPFADMEVAIVDELGRPVATGVEGEITVRPREPENIMQGYYNNFAATSRALRNLRLNTGDRGFVDAAGELHFLGRMGDAIRRRGVNISSEQIDEELMRHQNVRECAAIGVPSELGEEDIKILLVWREKPGDVDAALEGLVRFMQERLPRDYVPRYVEIVDAIPRTDNGKFRKAELRSRKDVGATWDREKRAWRQQPIELQQRR